MSLSSEPSQIKGFYLSKIIQNDQVDVKNPLIISSNDQFVSNSNAKLKIVLNTNFNFSNSAVCSDFKYIVIFAI